MIWQMKDNLFSKDLRDPWYVIYILNWTASNYYQLITIIMNSKNIMSL